jgi:hypothetical protein
MTDEKIKDWRRGRCKHCSKLVDQHAYDFVKQNWKCLFTPTEFHPIACFNCKTVIPSEDLFVLLRRTKAVCCSACWVDYAPEELEWTALYLRRDTHNA